MKGTCKAGGALTRRLVLAICIATAITVPCALSSCAPQNAADTKTEKGASTATSDTSELETAAYPSFYDNDTGLFPETEWNELYLNAGNRGCNSCHESLDNVMCMGREQHPVTRSGNASTHNSTILDGCMSCHDVHQGDYGMYFADAIHTVHNSSQQFTEESGGNCWSCHVITDSADLTQLGTWDIKLWEEVVYDGALGGYPDLITNPNTREFMKLIGHENGTPTDVNVDSETSFDITMSQELSTVDDSFTALNHNGTYGEENLYDLNHTVTLEGVKNPRAFTYDELAAMPQTTITATNQCVVAGSAGHNIYNATYSGVPLAYLVEQCGGLADGVNQAYLTAWDEWQCCWLDQRIENYLENGIIALTYFDGPLPYELGGPMAVVAPGVGGAFWCKWIQNINFTVGEAPYDFVETFADPIPGDELNYVSGAWFENDGISFSIGEGVTLDGYAYALATSVAPLKAIEFSTDLGVTWQRFDIPDNMDPYQWVTFTFEWQPPQAGTYIVKTRGVNANDDVNVTDGSVIVTVTE